MDNPKIIIVGAGMAGLSAALELEKLGYSPLLIEGSNKVGGRVRTEIYEGFILDVGFQILLSSYPEFLSRCKKDLNLRKFKAGAYYRKEEGWGFINPYSFWRWEKDTARGIFALGKALLTTSFEKPDISTEKFIQQIGAPEHFVQDFLAPFLRGVFLDKHLEVRASRFLQLFPLFIWGRACLPEKGMHAVPQWYQAQLKTTEIRLNSLAVEVSSRNVVLKSGEKIEGDMILLALSRPQLAKLLPSIDPGVSRATCCDYFAIESHLIHPEPYLQLDGRAESPINHFVFLSAVQPSYAPKGMHLLSATSMGRHPPARSSVLNYLSEELKIRQDDLRPLERKTVEHALPSQAEGPLLAEKKHVGLFLAGEICDTPSINDAIRSGRLAAQEIHADIS